MKYVSGVRENERRRQDWEMEEEMNKLQEKKDRINEEFQRRMNPKSKEDFDLLFRALESKHEHTVVNVKWNRRKSEMYNMLHLSFFEIGIAIPSIFI